MYMVTLRVGLLPADRTSRGASPRSPHGLGSARGPEASGAAGPRGVGPGTRLLGADDRAALADAAEEDGHCASQEHPSGSRSKVEPTAHILPVCLRCLLG